MTLGTRENSEILERMRNAGIERIDAFREETKEFNEFVKSVRMDIWANLELRLASAESQEQLQECLGDIDREYAVEQKLQEFLKGKKEENLASYALDLVHEIGDSALKCLPKNPDKSIAPQCQILREEFTRLREGDMNLSEMLRIIDSANKLFFTENEALIGEEKIKEWGHFFETKRVTTTGAFETLMEADFRLKDVELNSKKEELLDLIHITKNLFGEEAIIYEGRRLLSRIENAATSWNLEMKFNEIPEQTNDWNSKVEAWNELFPLLKKTISANQEFNTKLKDANRQRIYLISTDASEGNTRKYLDKVSHDLISMIKELGQDLSSFEKIKNYTKALKIAARELDSVIDATKVQGVVKLEIQSISNSFKKQIKENYSDIIEALIIKYPGNIDLNNFKKLIEDEMANIETYSQLPRMNAWAQQAYKKNFIALSGKQVKEYQQVVTEAIKDAKSKISQTDLGSMLQNEQKFLQALQKAKIDLEESNKEEQLLPRLPILQQTINKLEQKAKDLSPNWEGSLKTEVRAYDKFLKEAIKDLNLVYQENKTRQIREDDKARIRSPFEKAEAQIKASEDLIDQLPTELRSAPYITFDIQRKLRGYRHDLEELRLQHREKDVGKYQKKSETLTKKMQQGESHLRGVIQVYGDLQFQINRAQNLKDILNKEDGQNLAKALEDANLVLNEGKNIKTNKNLLSYVKKLNQSYQELIKALEQASVNR